MNPIGKLLGKGRKRRKKSKLGGYLAINQAATHDSPTRVDEAIELGADETVADFCATLCDALEAYAALEDDEELHIVQVGDGWLVACVCSGMDTPEHEDSYVRVAWSGSSATGFEFAQPTLVAARVVYEPEMPEPESPMDLDATMPRKRKRMGAKKCAVTMPFAAEVLADTPPVPLDTATNALPEVALAPERLEDMTLLERVVVSEAKALVSPSGKQFLAVLEGFGAVSGVVNENGRLYGDSGMNENVGRISNAIVEAFANGRAAPGGEVDHPTAEPTMSGLGTMLVGIGRDGNRVAIKLGVLDTSVGRDLLALHEYGFPIGISTVSYGNASMRTMDETDPYYAQNVERAGQPYYFIEQFRIEQFDAVRHPSARVFLNDHKDAPPAIVEAFARLCPDGELPDASGACPCRITETATMEDQTMNEDQLREVLGKLGIEADKIAALGPALAEVSEKISKLEERTTALTEALAVATATIDAQRETLATIASERDAAKFLADVGAAIDAEVAGKVFGEARRKFLHTMAESFDHAQPIGEQVAAAGTKFEAEVLPSLAPPVAVNERKVSETQKTRESAGGNGVLYVGDAIPFGYSAAASR